MTPTLVGNDVVDLADPRTLGKAESERFLERILSAGERAALAGAADPHGTLWALWACKEAAYKVASKLRSVPPVFVHRAFEVLLDPGADRPASARVRWEELELPVALAWDSEWVHAVAARPGPAEAVGGEVRALDGGGLPWAASFDALIERFTEREAEAVHSRASAAVRIAARAAVARALAVEEGGLEIVCAPGSTGRRPPFVLLHGEPAACDVSLSHHGRWIAWVVAEGDRPQKPRGR